MYYLYHIWLFLKLSPQSLFMIDIYCSNYSDFNEEIGSAKLNNYLNSIV